MKIENMAKLDSIQRINYIADFLRRKPASFKEINQYLEQKSLDDSCNYCISQKTFKRDLNLIADLLKIDIEFSPSLQKYKIEEETNNEINLRILESYDTFQALKMSADITQYIFFETRRVNGSEYLYPVINALKMKKMIRCDYQKFWDEAPTSRLLKPLALKENRNRWYLIAEDNKDTRIKTFGLDRISNFSLSDHGYLYPSEINIKDMFQNSFGIINDEDYSVEEIVLSFSKHQAKYIKSLPLHHSQVILFENEKECRIQLTLQPTHDFMMEILSLGKEVEIIEPHYLREELKDKLKQTLTKYE